MGLAGLEPARVLPRRILSPLRMPIPPQALRHQYSEKQHPKQLKCCIETLFAIERYTGEKSPTFASRSSEPDIPPGLFACYGS